MGPVTSFAHVGAAQFSGLTVFPDCRETLALAFRYSTSVPAMAFTPQNSDSPMCTDSSMKPGPSGNVDKFALLLRGAFPDRNCRFPRMPVRSA